MSRFRIVSALACCAALAATTWAGPAARRLRPTLPPTLTAAERAEFEAARTRPWTAPVLHHPQFRPPAAGIKPDLFGAWEQYPLAQCPNPIEPGEKCNELTVTVKNFGGGKAVESRLRLQCQVVIPPAGQQKGWNKDQWFHYLCPSETSPESLFVIPAIDGGGQYVLNHKLLYSLFEPGCSSIFPHVRVQSTVDATGTNDEGTNEWNNIMWTEVCD